MPRAATSILTMGFNPLHYGEGFLTTQVDIAVRVGGRRFNPLHYGEGFLTLMTFGDEGQDVKVSIPCITGRVS